MNIPNDPFLKDTEGAAKFCRDLLTFRGWRGTYDYSEAIYWSARCVAHWAMQSATWKAMTEAHS